MSYYKEQKVKPRYSKRVDPVKYSSICPGCETRYGKPHPLGVIEVKRCPKCPPLSFLKKYL